MEFGAVGGGVGSNGRPVERVLMARGRTAGFTILVVIVGLKGDGEVYSHKKARGIGASGGKRLSMCITSILPD